MSGTNVNVSLDELRKFSVYVENFRRYVDGDCEELQSAVNVLTATMDERSVSIILSMVKEITRLLQEQEPMLADLKDKVDMYGDFIARLKAVSGK